jgi:hypothetical protein
MLSDSIICRRIKQNERSSFFNDVQGVLHVDRF